MNHDRVITNYTTTLTTSHIFNSIEAKTAYITKTAYLFTVIFTTKRMSGIFNYSQSMTFCKVVNFIKAIHST